jgi:hypothetical protein
MSKNSAEHIPIDFFKEFSTSIFGTKSEKSNRFHDIFEKQADKKKSMGQNNNINSLSQNFTKHSENATLYNSSLYD